jgi:hypothetical protein
VPIIQNKELKLVGYVALWFVPYVVMILLSHLVELRENEMFEACEFKE